jgi:PAS domain S-box-containing protein
MLEELYKNANISLFINSLPGAFLIYKLDAEGKDSLLYLSDTAEALWGVSKEVATKEINKLWEPIHPDDLSNMASSIKESAENLSFWNHNWRIIHPSGETKWLNGRAQPIKQDDGSIIWQSVILDITALKEKELNVLELSKKLEVYAKKHSHELREPIAQLLGLLSLINDEFEDKESQEKYFVKQLLQSTEKLDRVVREMAADLEFPLKKRPK